MVQVTKKKKETTASLMKRFGQKVQKSSIVSSYKKRQFKNRKKSTLKKKRDALSRERTKDRLKKLYKLGKIDTPPTQ